MPPRERLVFLVGPTAIGKTKVAVYLAGRLNAEIISCDSMQVYKGMDIGTQKPAATQREKTPHYMIDIVSPCRNFSVAEFRKKALGYIKLIHRSKRIPIFVGGTALYMKAIIDGLFKGPAADRTLRNRLLKQEKFHGKGFLYNKLIEADPVSAKEIHPNDTRRIIRALEVYYKTKKPISELKKKTKGLTDKYEVRIFALNRNRHQLYSDIDKRVDKMFRQKLIEECRCLKKKRLSLTASQALGYKEVFAYLDSKIPLRQTKELIKKNTRHFAKRQLAWFRNDRRVVWVDTDNKTPKEVARAIYSLCMT
jgi:tRNA dimethylallyltransferase